MDSGTIDYQPVIIIGAGRSGTNMLRDVLTRIPRFGTWPCDEINYIWRHGNIKERTDEFSPEQATPQTKSYIKKSFEKLAKKQRIDYVVEKTCANSLRVGFVNEIFPNAFYIHIVRDGRDVVASAKKRWTAPLDIPYILRKARFVPVLDIPYYGFRYIWNHIYRIFSNEKHLAFWGPRFEGVDEYLKNYSLEEVCAIQWQRCVEKADEQLKLIDQSKVYHLKYEDFVENPANEMKKMCEFLSVKTTTEDIENAVNIVSKKSVGKGREEMDPRVLEIIETRLQDTLKRYGYEI